MNDIHDEKRGILRILKRDIGTGEEGKPVTLQQVLCLLLVFVIAIFFALAYSSKTDQSLKELYRVIFWVCVVLFCLSLFWHFKAHSSKRNIYPDILGAIVPPKEIYETGDVHLSFQPFQQNNYIVILAIIQNNCSSLTNFALATEIESASIANEYNVPNFKCSIPNSSVIKAQIHLPLLRSIANKNAILNFKIKAHGKAKERVKSRFNRRQALDVMPLWLKISAAIVGKLFLLGREKQFPIRLYPFEEEKSYQSDMQWNTTELGSPFDFRTPEEIIDLLLGEFEENGE